jgi:hypothetical protein
MIDYSKNFISSTDYFQEISNKLAASISAQKDKIIYEVLKENSAPIYNLTELVKSCRFIAQEGKNYQIFSYGEKNLLQIFDPEITCEDYKFKVEIKFKKLY